MTIRKVTLTNARTQSDMKATIENETKQSAIINGKHYGKTFFEDMVFYARTENKKLIRYYELKK